MGLESGIGKERNKERGSEREKERDVKTKGSSFESLSFKLRA